MGPSQRETYYPYGKKKQSGHHICQCCTFEKVLWNLYKFTVKGMHSQVARRKVSKFLSISAAMSLGLSVLSAARQHTKIVLRFGHNFVIAIEQTPNFPNLRILPLALGSQTELLRPNEDKRICSEALTEHSFSIRKNRTPKQKCLIYF